MRFIIAICIILYLATTETDSKSEEYKSYVYVGQLTTTFSQYILVSGVCAPGMTPEILLSGFQNNCNYQGQIQGFVKGSYSSSRLLQQEGLGNTVQGTLKLLALHKLTHENKVWY